jgi:hypothetical protein
VAYDEPWTCLSCGTGNVGRAFCEQCGRQRGWANVAIPEVVADEADADVSTSRGPLIATLVVLLLIGGAVVAFMALTRQSSQQKVADRAVLSQADLSGGWDPANPPSTNTFSRAELGQQAGACANADGPGPPKASASRAFRNGDPKSFGITRAGSAVLVYSTVDRARQALAYFASKPFTDCLANSLQENGGHDITPVPTIETQSVTKLPSAADAVSVQLRAIVRLSAKSTVIDMTVDVIASQVGRAVAITSFHSDTGPFPATEETRVVNLVTDRLR